MVRSRIPNDVYTILTLKLTNGKFGTSHFFFCSTSDRTEFGTISIAINKKVLEYTFPVG